MIATYRGIITGTSGTAGTGGTAGTSGISGTAGSSGTSGTSGTAGIPLRKNIYLIICDTVVHIPIVQISIICAPLCICSGVNMDNTFMRYMCHI